MTASVTRENLDEDTVVEEIVTPELIAALGAPESVAILRNGENLDEQDTLRDGDTIILERHASRKA